MRRENFFSPEYCSKVVKFAKKDCLDALIVLARNEQFLFLPWKWSKGGTIGWFFAEWNPTILIVFYLFIIFSLLTRINQPQKIFIFIYTDTFWPHSRITSANITYSYYLVCCVAVCVVINGCWYCFCLLLVFSFILIVLVSRVLIKCSSIP